MTNSTRLLLFALAAGIGTGLLIRFLGNPETPIFRAIGAPLAFIPLWIAVFAVPDILVTVCNVTADLSAATVIQHILKRQSGRAPAQAAVV